MNALSVDSTSRDNKHLMRSGREKWNSNPKSYLWSIFLEMKFLPATIGGSCQGVDNF